MPTEKQTHSHFYRPHQPHLGRDDRDDDDHQHRRRLRAVLRSYTTRQFVTLYAMDFAPDESAAFAEIIARAHDEAARLGIPHSAAGLYPAAIYGRSKLPELLSGCRAS